MQRSRRITHPASIEARVNDLSLNLSDIPHLPGDFYAFLT
jgi:hypothetical protein